MAVLWLASENARFVKLIPMTVDGGTPNPFMFSTELPRWSVSAVREGERASARGLGDLVVSVHRIGGRIVRTSAVATVYGTADEFVHAPNARASVEDNAAFTRRKRLDEHDEGRVSS